MKSLFMLFFLLPLALHAGFERSFRPASAWTMGKSPIAAYGFGCWLVNPASLATTKGTYLLTSFSPAPFGISELNEGGAGCALNTKIGGFGTAASVFGCPLYKEYTGRLSWGNSLGSMIDIGLSFSWYHLSIQNYGSSGTAGLDAGVIVHCTPSVHGGFVITNVTRACIGPSREPIPQTLAVGAVVDLMPQVSVSIEAFKDIQFPVSIRYGFEYTPMNVLSFSLGTSTEPSVVAGGIGFSFSYFHFDYAIQYHQPLGISHTVTLIVSFSPIH
jgi:hypothetical protein